LRYCTSAKLLDFGRAAIGAGSENAAENRAIMKEGHHA
jgi:hypothetical protein